MALCKYSSQAIQYSADAAFDSTSGPGQSTPFSGIYRCVGCGHEVTGVQGKTMPPQSHHQHTSQQGAIAWQLIVATTHAS